jgi:penicillin-binding protein 1A
MSEHDRPDIPPYAEAPAPAARRRGLLRRIRPAHTAHGREGGSRHSDETLEPAGAERASEHPPGASLEASEAFTWPSGGAAGVGQHAGTSYDRARGDSADRTPVDADPQYGGTAYAGMHYADPADAEHTHPDPAYEAQPYGQEPFAERAEPGYPEAPAEPPYLELPHAELPHAELPPPGGPSHTAPSYADPAGAEPDADLAYAEPAHADTPSGRVNAPDLVDPAYADGAEAGGNAVSATGPRDAALAAAVGATAQLRAAPRERAAPAGGPPQPPFAPDAVDSGEPDEVPRTKPRLKKLRFALILFAAMILGLISFVFGMFMAVASDLPSLEDRAEYNNARNSILLDDQGRQLGVLSDHNRILLLPGQVPQIVKEAVISVEDKRFYSNNGIDVRGIMRALLQDVLHNKPVQGASTIEQQFVKNALQAQTHRTIFEKLRESALAYHLTRKWSKEKIITEYLNTIYFGNGAYGIESAARTYFGQDPNHLGCGTTPKSLCVTGLKPYEAALLAGMIASPAAYDPVEHPLAALRRRNLVLKDMLDQGDMTQSEYNQYVTYALPSEQAIQPPQLQQADGLQTGYFTDWVRQQLIDRYGPGRALEGGLVVRTTLDLDLQRAAQQAVDNYLSYPGGPTASMVVLDNATGEVRAMVGGRDYTASPFNLATEGERQPGSAFKAFDLAAALVKGYSPDSVWASRVKTFIVPNSGGKEVFVVHNDNNAYSGSISLTDATAYSDNSVFAELGIDTGTRRIAQMAHNMGIRTPISTNPAMTIGGLRTGVTALDMAHAYETLAHGGERVGGTLVCQPGSSTAPAAPCLSGGGPVGIERVTSGKHVDVDKPVLTRVLPTDIASTETSMLEGVVQYGTGRAAAIGQFAAGKTGTTTNYGDAWFVGWNSKYTVAVWVGYPDSLKPMMTDFNGGPVLGGTFPALIWHDFMTAAIQIDQNRAAQAAAQAAQQGGASSGQSSATGPATTASPSTSPTPSGSGSAGTSGGGSSAGGGGGSSGGGAGGTGGRGSSGGSAGGGGGNAPAPQTPAPSTQAPSTPAPAPTAPSSSAPPPSSSTPSSGAGSSGGARAPSG